MSAMLSDKAAVGEPCWLQRGVRMKWNDLDAASCALARTVSIVGDRWSLLVLRDAFLGVTRFEDFHERLGIGRRILTERLKKLVDHFILVKVPYRQSPLRYEYRLTPKGRDLYPVIRSLASFGEKHLSGAAGPLAYHVHTCGRPSDLSLVCTECGEPLDERTTHVYRGPGAPDNRLLPPLPALIGSLAGNTRAPAQPAKVPD